MSRPIRYRTRPGRAFLRIVALGALATTFCVARDAAGQLRREAPKALSDTEFWDFFTTMSEPGGKFASENYVSNEIAYQQVIPALQRSLTRNGVYLGVGPEQNFTYIANLKPRMAVIFDIRRQNAMAQLMYKAIFEQSPTRAEFVARLFSRPLPRLARGVKVADLFNAVAAAPASDSAFRANHESIVRTLTEKHRFALSADDLQSIKQVHTAFFQAGPEINYGYVPGWGRRVDYPTFGMLQLATNADSVLMAFLATEERYAVVRELQLRNLIVPVVGDFAGPKAIRGVGEYLQQRRMTVTAFYVSNVEQYLFQQGDAAQRFYANVATLPVDSTSTFIRSVMQGADMAPFIFPAVPLAFSRGTMTNGNMISMVITTIGGVRVGRMVIDSAGTRITRVVRDSAGQLVVDTARGRLPASVDSLFAGFLGRPAPGRDSAMPQPPAPPRTAAAPPPTSGTNSLFTSGLTAIRFTLDEVAAGRVSNYREVIGMTKTSDWK